MSPLVKLDHSGKIERGQKKDPWKKTPFISSVVVLELGLVIDVSSLLIDETTA